MYSVISPDETKQRQLRFLGDVKNDRPVYPRARCLSDRTLGGFWGCIPWSSGCQELWARIYLHPTFFHAPLETSHWPQIDSEHAAKENAPSKSQRSKTAATSCRVTSHAPCVPSRHIRRKQQLEGSSAPKSICCWEGLVETQPRFGGSGNPSCFFCRSGYDPAASASKQGQAGLKQCDNVVGQCSFFQEAVHYPQTNTRSNKKWHMPCTKCQHSRYISHKPLDGAVGMWTPSDNFQ